MVTRVKKTGNMISLLLSGCFVGWFIGMSVSPIVKDIIVALLVVLVGAISFLAGVKSKEENSQDKPARIVNTWPITLMFFGLLIGAMSGVWMRTHDYLGQNMSDKIKTWEKTGYSEQEIAKKIFEYEFGKSTEAKATSLNSPLGTNLFSNKSKICDDLCIRTGNDLKTSINRIPDDHIRIMLESAKDSISLSKKIDSLCSCK